MSYNQHDADYDDEEDDGGGSHNQPRMSPISRFMDKFFRGGDGDDEDKYYEDPSDIHTAASGSQMPQRDQPQSQTPPLRPATVINGMPQFDPGGGGSAARVSIPGRAAGGALNPMRRPTTVAPMRVERERVQSVTVRRTVQSFEDVRRAVDGLREGVQQIVNIEQTPPEVAERLIDFLNGATYAMDGSVEKIGTQVYLFTPSTITIDVEDKTKLTVSKPFFDRE